MNIEMKALVKVYNENKPGEYKALRGIDLSVREGEMVAIIGKSGSGKTTLLNILAGISSYTSGQYLADGEEIGALGDKEIARFRNGKIGLVMQDFALIEGYTILENVMIPLMIAKGKKDSKRKLAEDAIRDVGLYNLKTKKVNQLSGGQKQRVAIARAMVNNPDILLADEPTGALDTKTSAEIMDIFKELHKKGKTVIIVTHDLDIANSCERVIEISDGKIAEESGR